MGNNSLFLIILVIIPIVLIAYVIIKKKNNNSGNDRNKKSANKLKNKQEEDEVWLTIKRYLREKNEVGKEVVDSYVVKRPDPRVKTKANKKQLKAAAQELKALKKSNPEEYKAKKELKKIENRKKQKELYVVLFTTKNTKTHVTDAPRAIECEVVYKKADKGLKRSIVINGPVDYEKEMEWIKPIKAKDDKELARQLRVEQRREVKRKQKQEKKKIKDQANKAKKDNVK